MPERPSPGRRPARTERPPLFSANEIRIAFIASLVGMVGFLVLILMLANARPQGAYTPADASEFRSLVGAAADNLAGYELVGESRARIDIDRAIELVAERGVDLPLTELGAGAVAQAPAGADDGDEGDGEAAAAADVDGEAIYGANCASCHGPTGGGVPGAFPPLGDGHMPSLAAAEGGRAFLIRAVLYGLQGPIEANGQAYNGVMPAWGQLSDAEIAGVLNHELTAWGNDASLPDGWEPIAPDEVADARGEELSPADVLDLRPEPGAAPAADASAPAEDDPAEGEAAEDEAAEDEPDEAPAEEDAAADEAAEAPAEEAEADAADGDEAAEEDAAEEEAAADEAADEPESGDAAAAADLPDADGEAVYGANCASCHQPNGQGIPGAFPPLAGGHMPTVVAAEGGRAFLIRAVLYGLQGPIEANGQAYNGVMPAWGQLSDDEIAAVLNHEITGWDNEGELPDGFQPLSADEVADARGEDLSPADVLELRPELD